MKSKVIRFQIQTEADTQLINITEKVRQMVCDSGIQNGIATIMTLHTTTALTINEGLEDIERDLIELLMTLIPADRAYNHARFLHSDGQMAVNAPSHLRSALLGMQVSLPVENGELIIGQRQTIYFVELDGPLNRECVLQVLGE